ncbi:hypothetical protein GCM10017668_03730 [Streptomyces tuirus]|uniref:Uncharacterized protein n=1 Tax=Streptomyces tuirus TaxID=68278 RepID=A0A7G1NA18_9ACTN|nr:hypothetical protein GCM10017668_03730 [Streptomyces tuirus]
MGIIRNKARMNVFMLLANQLAYTNTAHGSRPGQFPDPFRTRGAGSYPLRVPGVRGGPGHPLGRGRPDPSSTHATPHTRKR